MYTKEELAKWGDNITITAVRKLGFTDKLIKELLPAPKLYENPKDKKYRSMKIFSKKAVFKAMKHPKFIAEQQKQKNKIKRK